MGLTALRSLLARHRRVALDTCIFIYQLEGDSRYSPLTDGIFDWLEHPAHAAVTSSITMLELLVKPDRDLHDEGVSQVFALFSSYPNLRWIAPDLATADLAAKIRAVHRLATPDALQAACAVEAGATALITNDSIFQRMDRFETIILDHLVGRKE